MRRGNYKRPFSCTRHAKQPRSVGSHMGANRTRKLCSIRLTRLAGRGVPCMGTGAKFMLFAVPPKWEYQNAQAVALLWKLSAS